MIRRLGAGGMGVVFLARDETLGRDVALKLILPERLYVDESRARFRREVEAAAKLNHPSIVPIYSVGEHDAMPYFTMEFVSGASLADAIESVRERRVETLRGDDLRAVVASHAEKRVGGSTTHSELGTFAGTWIQSACRIALQIAEALEHAHSRGVLHRDVKPSNVVVSTSGRAQLVDFGLAISDEAVKLTRTDTQLGSLPYMAPERLSGGLGASDARADVYALGVTLYELLTLRLPFDAESFETLYRAILSGEHPSLRAHNSSVPLEVEIVCATAMERDAERRYATAQDFADDLRNLLELRPIRARPVGAMLRARRWVQRNPTISASLALGFLLVVVAPSIAWWRIRRERDAALLELRARRSVMVVLRKLLLAADPLNDSAEGQRSISEIIDEGTQRIQDDLADFPEIRANLLTDLAATQYELQHPREARALYESALALFRELYGDDGVETLKCRYHIAVVQMQSGEQGLALNTFREVGRALEKSGDDPELTRWTVQNDIANALITDRSFDQARTLLQEIQTLPHTDEDQIAWTSSMSKVEGGLGHVEEGQRLQAEVVELYEKRYGAKSPVVGRALQDLATLEIGTGELDHALAHLERARAIRQDAKVVESLEDARLAFNLAGTYNRLGRIADAEPEFARALQLTRRFAGDSVQAAYAASGMGAVLFKLDRLDEAEKVLREALDLSRRYVPRSGVHAAEAPLWLARCLVKRGHPDEALPLFEEVLACTRDDAATPARVHAKFENETADLLEALGNSASAKEHRERAAEWAAADESQK